MGSIAVSSGTAANPGVRFKEETNSGFYRPESGVIGTSILGNRVEESSGTTKTFYKHSGDTASFEVALKKSRGTASSPANVANNDILGTISFSGYYGGSYYPGASIKAEVDGAPGSSDMPGRLIFSTTLDGAASVTERMRISNDGHVGIGTTSPSGSLGGGGTPVILKVSGASSGTVPWGLLVLQTQVTASANDIVGGIEFGSSAVSGNKRGGYIYVFKNSSSSSFCDAYMKIGLTNSSGTATDVITVSASECVSIGTTSPASKFHVYGGRSYFGGAGDFYAVGVAFSGSRSANGQVFFLGATDSTQPDLTGCNAAGSELFRCTYGGRLGIGTNAGIYGKLQVDYNGIYVSASASNSMGVSANAESTADFWINYHGYQDSTAQYRDFKVGNGKEGVIFTMTGSTGNCWIFNDCSATSFTDRTRAFKLETSLRIVGTIECNDDGELDHASLSDEIRVKRKVKDKNGNEMEEEGRDLSGTVSAVHMVAKYLLEENALLKERLNKLEQAISN